jgi:tryptophan-rich hypothetical protein
MTPRPKNPLSPKKLLHTKWTAVAPTQREKHFLVTHVVLPEPPATRVELVDLQAVHSLRTMRMPWRELTDASRWRQGWV